MNPTIRLYRVDEIYLPVGECEVGNQSTGAGFMCSFIAKKKTGALRLGWREQLMMSPI